MKQTAYNWPAKDCAAAVGAIAACTKVWNTCNGDKTPEKRIAKDETKENSKGEVGG